MMRLSLNGHTWDIRSSFVNRAHLEIEEPVVEAAGSDGQALMGEL